MKKIWVKKVDTFEAANRFDAHYYLSMGSKKRLETMQLLREIYFKMKGGEKDESGKGLRRVVKIVQ